MDIYHVYTKGMAKKLWFQDSEDYKFGMNNIPVCAIISDVDILCFCLMSNHVHFVLRGREDNCVRFIREYKRQNSKYLKSRYRKSHLLSGSDIGIKKIKPGDHLKTAIAYVLRNPVAAGLGVMPSEYLWSSACAYFSEASSCRGMYCRLEDLSGEVKRKIFKTRVQLPDNYILREDGTIFPGSYVDFRTVENVYFSPRQLLFHLSSNKDMEEELESGILTKASYNDSDLRASMESLCTEMFRGKEFTSLKIEDRYRIAKEIRKRYGAGPKQISRITALDYGTLKTLLG